MASERTFVTEIATGLGMVGGEDIGSAVRSRARELANLTDGDWMRLESAWASGTYREDFRSGYRNGRAFAVARDALAGRHPQIVEWTGGRRPPGDEVVPSDLRIDHVYLVSCKYLSRILHNASPARLVDALLAHDQVLDLRDWYARVAPREYETLYSICNEELGDARTAGPAAALTTDDRRRLSAVASTWSKAAVLAYERLCRRVSSETARLWRERLDASNVETMLWRLLRIGSAPYFILGTSPRGPMRLRIDTPWDWRQSYRLRRFDIEAQAGGQPRIGWSATYELRRTGEDRTVRGHVELRWSHGRFSQPPEAKVYLDTPHEDVPGYHLL